MIEPKVFTVGQINRYIKNLLENDFILSSLLVQGEISNFKAHSSGHWYFTLKDAQGAISCVIFKQDAQQIPFEIENGMRVILCGRVSLYEKAGQYQIYGEFLEPIGIGALQLAFEQLKAKLSEEGLFDADFKREIPERIGCIAVITSPTGAAVRDIIQIAKRRDPRVKIALFPTLVQGDAAAEDIVRSLHLANEWGKADVILLGRGGGSMEDLWAFNEEIVARAIFASEIPVISAVGHETDFTIADFVADLRAPTPSAAAELATASLDYILEDIAAMEERLHRNLSLLWNDAERRFLYLREHPAFKRPLERIRRMQIALAERERLFLREARHRLERENARLLAAEKRLAAVSPLSIMGRGYAMLTGEAGAPIAAAEAVSIGQELQIRMKDGLLRAKVTEKRVFGDGEEETHI